MFSVGVIRSLKFRVGNILLGTFLKKNRMVHKKSSPPVLIRRYFINDTYTLDPLQANMTTSQNDKLHGNNFNTYLTVIKSQAMEA
jgi:hypothetical protein